MSKSAPLWKQVAENLVRHRSGTYYLSAKIRGEKVRRSLGTKDLAVAKMKRDDQLSALRGVEVTTDTLKKVGDALELVANRRIRKPGLKPNTVRYYENLRDILREELPVKLNAAQWRRDDVRAWWEKTGKARKPTQANNLLQLVRQMGRAIRDAGLRADVVTTGLFPVPVRPSAVHELPTQKKILEVLQHMRENLKNSRGREEAADMIEFLAWSGLRMGEIRALEWRDVGPEWITIHGGEAGTKNNQVRRIPINPRLAEIIGRRRHEGAAGPLFSLKNPKNSFRWACRKAKIPELRNHDLRHIFATTAIERGVDVPTVAKWLGHKDGGILAMRTYGHLRDEHSLEASKKMA